MDPARPGAFGFVENGAIGVTDGRIAYAGAVDGLPTQIAAETIRCGGLLATPALVDCHTHLVFGGDRAEEFDRRLRGATYEEIARAGGGILSTVRATRGLDVDGLVAAALPRINALKRGGTATIEIKSGYGLDAETELRMLVAATRLGAETGLRIRRTLLALHALPPEHARNRAAYVREVCEHLIPEAARRGLADAVDAFCEKIAFTLDETRAVFEAARAAGLPVKLHAEQLSNMRGARLAAAFGALSADHLEHADEDAVAAMAQAGTVAVLLPGAFYALKDTLKPPVALFRKHGVPMAVATDLNPGTSPVLSPSLMMNMAATLFGLTPEEALAGMTREGARALGLVDETGMLRAGLSADIALWRAGRPEALSYWIGHPGPERLVIRGADA